MASEILAPHSVRKRADVTSREIAELHDRCGIFTKDITARSMLGSIGWSEHKDLSQARLLDPCVGEGAFIVPAAEILIASLKRAGLPLTLETLSARVCGIEIHGPAFEIAKSAVGSTLMRLGVDETTALGLCDSWLRQADFLLGDFGAATFTHVVANPPYARWSNLPPGLSATYRRLLPGAWTSGDLSVAFIGKMIDLAARGGRLALLSSDRWMHAAHADKFRKQWLRKVHVDHVEKVSPREVFRTAVATYPAIATMTRVDTGDYHTLPALHVVDKVAGALFDTWVSRFPSIVQAGCEIRVGPALGPEAAFVGRSLDVEEELLMPYLRLREIVGDGLAWEGDRVISVHSPGGGLLDLRRYPRAGEHLGHFREHLERRACIKRSQNAERWYRTIDRVDRSLWARDKILLPEIFLVPRIALDQAGHVPSHSIYAIFTSIWPLGVLRDLLASGVLGAVMECIAPRIGGGCVRCYKRFLSRLPLPLWESLPKEVQHGLATSSAAGNRARFTELVADIYGVEADVLWRHATLDWRGRDQGGILGDEGV